MELVTRGKLLLVLEAQQKLAGQALGQPLSPEGALDLINRRYALRSLTAADVDLRRMALANDQVDRTYERFSPAMLQQLARTLVGKSVLAHHLKWDYPLGRFYGATVERSADGWTWLMAEFYMLKSEENAALRGEIDAGVTSYVSIGFRGGKEWCDLCGGWWQPWDRSCGHWPGETYRIDGVERVCTLTWEDPDGTAEAVEGSFVWLGAQYEAAVVKSLSRERGGAREMERIKELEAEVERLQAELALRQESVKLLNEGQLALSKEKAVLVQQLADVQAEAGALKALSTDGEQYRADLMAEIKRLGGLVGAEKEASTVAAALAPAGVQALKEARDEYQQRVDAAFPPAPNGLPATTTEEKPLRAAPAAGVRAGYGLV